MKSQGTAGFWRLYRQLPGDVRHGAREAYARWFVDPHSQGLAFKQVHPTLPVWSVRVGIHWRALGKRDGDIITWFWIGSHAEYDKLLKRL